MYVYHILKELNLHNCKLKRRLLKSHKIISKEKRVIKYNK